MKCKCKMTFTTSKRKKRVASKTGESFLQEYKIWAGLKSRCNPKSKSRAWAPYYVGKVKICVKWKNSFSDFYRDLGPRPGPRYSVDRIDGKRGYCPHNCRWATAHEQVLNRRSTKNKENPLGVKKNKSGTYTARISILGRMFQIGTFKSKEEAVAEFTRYNEHLNNIPFKGETSWQQREPSNQTAS